MYGLHDVLLLTHQAAYDNAGEAKVFRLATFGSQVELIKVDARVMARKVERRNYGNATHAALFSFLWVYLMLAIF